MSLIRHLPHALAVLIVLLGLVAASSAPPRPLKRIAHPSTLSLEILPRRAPIRSRSTNSSPNPNWPFHPSPTSDSPTLLHSDSLRLTLAAFGQTIHLHLRPAEHLIHPAARVNVFRTDENGQSVLDRTLPLRREDVRAYEGEVYLLGDASSQRRMREDAAGGVRSRKQGWREMPGEPARGWARVMVHDQGEERTGRPPLWEGAFSLDGVIHHVVQRDHYLRNRLEHDPHPHSNGDDVEELDAELVIFRDSDVMSPTEEALVRAGGAIPADLDSRSKSTPDADRPPAHTCSHDALPFNRDPWLNPVLRMGPSGGASVAAPPRAWYDPLGMLEPSRANASLAKRQDAIGGDMTTNFAGTIGQTAGCSTTQKVVYMGVAADCTYVSLHSSVQNATSQIINNWNMASSLYKSNFNVSLGLLHIDIQDPTCPPTGTGDADRPWNTPCGTVTLNDRLSLFSAWRGARGDDGAGLWHLMSGCPTGTEVGVAWLGTLCQQDANGRDPNVVSGAAVSTTGRTEWQIVAHEIGHNFGAIHDCQDGCSSSSMCCPLSTSSCSASDGFIMSPVTSSSQAGFSQCSIGNICSLMLPSSTGRTNTSCLLDPDPNRQTISLEMCGNGIVENGEDCDPGVNLANSTASPCCDPATCRFREGAVCDPMSSSCCTTQCQFSPATTVCRPAVDASCDTAETCSGTSAGCPQDVFAPNGQSCGAGSLACANGICTSTDQQCQIVGASMGLQRACSRPDNSCQLQCQDPTNSAVCIQLQAQLIDGSPCGFGGTCVKGNCQSGSVLDTAKAWYLANLQISIPVTIVAGIVALMLLWGLFVAIRRCCRRRSNRIEPTYTGLPGSRVSSWQAPLVAPVAPLASSPPSRRLSSRRSTSIPNALRPAGPPEPTFRNVPPSSFTRPLGQPPRVNRSWDGQYGLPQPGYGVAGSRNSRGPSNWVDPTAYNGPHR